MTKQKSKTIRGKQYLRDMVWASKGTTSKKQAYKIAAEYRRIGHRARVVEERTARGKRYFVYYRGR